MNTKQASQDKCANRQALRRGWSRWIAWRLGVVALLMGVLGVFHAPVLRSAAELLDAGVTPASLDYVVALPGGLNTRTLAAGVLQREGIVQQVLVIQNEDDPEVLDGIVPPAHVTTMALYAARGVTDDRVRVLHAASTSTEDDIRSVSQIWEAQPDAVVGVVTDWYHARRAAWTCAAVLGDRASQVQIVSVPNDRFERTRWWVSEARGR